MLAGCDRKATNVKLYKGHIATDDRYLASTFSEITCKELAQGLCAQYGDIDKEFTCYDGPTLAARVMCDELDGAKQKHEAAVVEAPVSLAPPYHANVVWAGGSTVEHIIRSYGQHRKVRVRASKGAQIKCTWTDGRDLNNIVAVKSEKGSACDLALPPEMVLVFVKIELLTIGNYTIDTE